MLTIPQQIFEAIKKSNRILIAFRQNPSGDSIASALGLFLILKKMEKNADVISTDFLLPKNFDFLPEAKRIAPTISSLKKIVISLDVSKNKVQDFSYDIKDGKLNIFVSPETGAFDEKQIKATSSGYKYDLIFTVDTYDLESLGKIYDENTDFFFSTPVVNLDHSPDNEHFGQINFVDITATSTAEMVYNLVESFDTKLIDENIATCLLTGVYAKTRSFKTNQLTPRSLTIASQLIAFGARRDEIIQNLYHNRTLGTLKIWGKVLARLRNEPGKNLVWSILEKKDFDEAGVGPECLTGVIDELISNAPEAKVIAIIYETAPNQARAILYTDKSHDALLLAKPFEPKGTKNLAHFGIKDKNLIEAQREVVSKIRERLEKLF